MLDCRNKKILILSATAMFSIFVVFFMIFDFYVLSKYNRCSNEISTYIKDISKINITASAITDGQTVNTKSGKLILPQTITSLSKLDATINNHDDYDNYKSTFDCLNEGLNFNILMYKQLLSIINNPDSPDISTSVNNVTKYKNSCNKYYLNIKSKDSAFSLPASINTLVNNTSNMVSSFIRTKKENEIIDNENSEFDNNLQNVLTKFSSIKCNLYYYAECARKNNISYDSAIAKVTKNQNDFNDLSEHLSEIIVPENRVSIYSALKKVFDDYDLYLKSFINAINKEKKCTTVYSSKDLSNLYKDANSKLDLMNSDLTLLKDKQHS